MIGTYLNGIFYLFEGLVRLLPSLQQILCYATELWVGNFDLIQYLLDGHVELWSLNPHLLTIVVFCNLLCVFVETGNRVVSGDDHFAIL